MIRRQLALYVAIGLVLTIALYGAYLLLTDRVGLRPRMALTITYPIGVACSFFLNRKFTFRHKAAAISALPRYFACYSLGYMLNFIALWLMVNQFNVPHELVQGGTILVLPIFLFAIQKYWVFVAPESAVSKRPESVIR